MKKPKKTYQKEFHAEKKAVLPSKGVDVDGFTLPMGWNFGRMDQRKNFAWRCTLKRLSKYRNRLISFEKKSFQEIEAEYDSSHPWKDISVLNKKFLKDIDRKGIELSELWQLELTGVARLFGIRENNIFVVMWLDEGHTIYKVDKSHT